MSYRILSLLVLLVLVSFFVASPYASTVSGSGGVIKELCQGCVDIKLEPKEAPPPMGRIDRCDHANPDHRGWSCAYGTVYFTAQDYSTEEGCSYRSVKPEIYSFLYIMRGEGCGRDPFTCVNASYEYEDRARLVGKVNC